MYQNINEEILSVGGQLAKTKWSRFMEGLDDSFMQATVAILLENQDKYQRILNETVTTPAIASFEKYSFPLIRAIIPNLVATDIVSVQPMTGPTSLVFYLAFVYGSNKGQTTKGSVMMGLSGAENPDSNYSSEVIDNETLATGTASGTTFSGTCSYIPVRPSTFTVTDGTVTGRDDGNGNLVGAGITSGAINYNNGSVSVVFAAPPAGGVTITISYEYNSEGSDRIPEVDLVLSSSPVVARPRKLRSRWSLEAAHNLKAVHGLDAEAELTAVLAGFFGHCECELAA